MTAPATPTDFPMTIDSTMRGAFVSCPQKYYLEYFLHWKPKAESVDLVAGKAFAAGIEAARKEHWLHNNHDTQACIHAGALALIKEWGDFEAPTNHPKQLDRMIGALDEYFTQYGFTTDHIQPLMQNDTPAVEFSFALPIPNTCHPTTGEPILYTGRFDMVGVYNTALFIVDEKTTRQLGATWFKNWTLRAQLTGYCWAAQQFGYPVAGAIIRGISILKNNYGHAESIQYRSPWQIDIWLLQLQRDVARMIQCWKDGFWDYSFDTACTNYGGCSFLEICSNQHPEKLLELSFEKRIWDPMKREEVPIPSQQENSNG